MNVQLHRVISDIQWHHWCSFIAIVAENETCTNSALKDFRIHARRMKSLLH